MRRKPVVFVNDFNCISRMFSLTFSLESFSYILLDFVRKRYTLEMLINGEIHPALQRGGPLRGVHLEGAQHGMDSRDWLLVPAHTVPPPI